MSAISCLEKKSPVPVFFYLFILNNIKLSGEIRIIDKIMRNISTCFSYYICISAIKPVCTSICHKNINKLWIPYLVYIFKNSFITYSYTRNE